MALALGVDLFHRLAAAKICSGIVPGGAAFTCTGASGLVGGGLLLVGIMGDALVVKTWPLVEVQAPGTAELLTPGCP